MSARAVVECNLLHLFKHSTSNILLFTPLHFIWSDLDYKNKCIAFFLLVPLLMIMIWYFPFSEIIIMLFFIMITFTFHIVFLHYGITHFNSSKDLCTSSNTAWNKISNLTLMCVPDTPHQLSQAIIRLLLCSLIAALVKYWKKSYKNDHIYVSLAPFLDIFSHHLNMIEKCCIKCDTSHWILSIKIRRLFFFFFSMFINCISQCSILSGDFEPYVEMFAPPAGRGRDQSCSSWNPPARQAAAPPTPQSATRRTTGQKTYKLICISNAHCRIFPVWCEHHLWWSHAIFHFSRVLKDKTESDIHFPSTYINTKQDFTPKLQFVH